MLREIEEIQYEFDQRLDSEQTRQRVIEIVCDAKEVVEVIEKCVDSKIDVYDKDVKISAYERYFNNWKYWIPIIAFGLFSSASLLLSIVH